MDDAGQFDSLGTGVGLAVGVSGRWDFFFFFMGGESILCGATVYAQLSGSLREEGWISVGGFS